MSEIIKRKVRVLHAQYVKEADSIVIVGECNEGRLRNQIHRSCFRYGGRTEEEIENELKKTAKMMIGKIIMLEFNPNLIERK